MMSDEISSIHDTRAPGAFPKASCEQLTDQQLRLLISSLQDHAIFMVDPAGLIVSWNEGAERMTGYSPQDVLGQTVQRFFLNADVERGLDQREYDKARDCGRSEVEAWRRRKDGSLFWANVITAAIRDENGQLIGYSKIVRDLTKRKQDEDELNALMQQREDFVAILTHDLKTPILAANRALQLLLEGDFGELRPAQSKLLQTIRDSNDAMYRLVALLLEVYKYDSGAKRLAIGLHDLNEIVKNVLALLKPVAESKSLQLEAELPPSAVPVECDGAEIRRVMLNLLDNAVKYTPSGGKVKVEVVHSPVSTTFVVSDTGDGIEPEQQSSIFKRFHQVKAEQHTHAGAGLGLYISRQIVEAHDGNIGFKSSPGAGTTFYFTLPNAHNNKR